MPPTPPNFPRGRPTLRTIAEMAGVSPMALSLALRNRPGIAPETRKRLLKLAEEAGYRPDPAISKLMVHLRTRRSTRIQAMVCALGPQPAVSPGSHTSLVFAGASQRAAELGLGLDLIFLDEVSPSRPERARRILRSRGIEGMLLLPVLSECTFEELLRSDEFSAVATSYTPLWPEVHRVIPNQFDNTLLACRRLEALGYRRIGMVLSRRQDDFGNHRMAAAMAWHNLYCTPHPVPALLTSEHTAEELSSWFDREHPDAIVCRSTAELEMLERFLQARNAPGIALVNLSVRAGSRFAGVDERAFEIGRTSLDLLARLIRHGEKGPPADPNIIMITGKWVDGASVSDRPSA